MTSFRENKKKNKINIYKAWLYFAASGAFILVLTFYAPNPFLLSVVFICLCGFTGWLLYRFYRSLSIVQEGLYNQSLEDQLTGVKNRRYLEERMIELLTRYGRSGEGFGVIFFDLDCFRECNKQYGHTTGDRLLQEVAKYLQESTRKQDSLARYGGDEFILLLPDSTLNEAVETAERIRQGLGKKMFVVNGEKFSLQICGGVSACPDDGTQLEALLDVADQCLQQAKIRGNKICLSEKSSEQIVDLYPPMLINKKDYYLDKVGKQTTQLYLLAKSGDLEIIRLSIVADKILRLWGEENIFEFYYLLEGEMSHSKEEITFTPGTSIILRNLTEEIYLKTKTDCTLLYVTTTPAFKYHQEEIRELLSLSKKVEIKDQQTDEHCLRLQELSRRTGEKLGLREEQLFTLDYASLLHDIGKAEVPASILRKPGGLDQEEWALVRMHSQWGCDLIHKHLKNRGLFEKVADIVLQHHERYDGKGYPRGLAGEEILIEAQILTVVDSYDAMTTDRPYRRAVSREEALEEIKTNKGSQYAPRVVDAFLEAEEEDFCQEE